MHSVFCVLITKARAVDTSLYHYTSLTGMIGIITSKAIWATDCSFLNDRSEFDYARTLFLSELALTKPARTGSRLPSCGRQPR